MSRTYKATGINLKSLPMGEADRLVTVLTREFGIIRAIAPGARKHNSKLGGRSGLFVVNELLIAKGRSLDKITQAETLESYPGLGRDLKKLTAGQYLAELTLNQALEDHPEVDLFDLLNEHLTRLERSPSDQVLPHLTHGIYQLLGLAGVAPEVHRCCVTQAALTPDFSQVDWRIGFNPAVGGTLSLAAAETLRAPKPRPKPRVKSPAGQYGEEPGEPIRRVTVPTMSGDAPPSRFLTATELFGLQHLAQTDLLEFSITLPTSAVAWREIERVLRQYTQYHFDRPIRSAALIDTCFAPPEPERSA
jgi:DNA repair protein RecO (recombination protein O)